jgi:phage-related tail fiber protein
MAELDSSIVYGQLIVTNEASVGGALKVGGAIIEGSQSLATKYLGIGAGAVKLATARTISITGDVTGSGIFDGSTNLSISVALASTNSATATKWATARTITLAGDVTGSVSIDGSANATLTATVADDSHTHDGRYYTETEADTRFINVVEGTAISSYRRVLEYENNVSTQTGIIKITLPNSWTDTMLMIDMDIYDYSTKGYAKLMLGGYNSITTPGWVQTSVVVSGALASNRVRFAHDGTKCCILLGDITTVWQYPKLLISKVHATFSNETLWGTGWNVSIVTTETGLTSSAEPVVNAGLSAATATKLATVRTISATGDVTGSTTYDGSGNSSMAMTLATVASAGTYKSVVVNAKGLVTSGTNPTTLAGYGIADAIINTDVVTVAAANKILRLDANAKLPASITGNADGNAATATKLATVRTITTSGDVTGSTTYDGSGNSTLALTLATVASAGTYKSVVVNAKGLVTSGTNPTTLVGYGITDATPFATLTSATPATLGWYRISTSAVNILGNGGLFKVDFSGVGVRGSVLFRASCNDGITVGTNINQLGFVTTAVTLGLTKARIVYHTTPTANYAYVEVYNPSALAITYVVDVIDSTGWTLVTPSTVGSIPAGYTSKELTFDMGVVSGDDVTATSRLISNVATGTAPIVVASTTLVTNLNVDLLDSMHAATTNVVSSIVSRDASGNFSAGTITAALTGNATTATRLATTRAISLTGDATGTANFDGSAASAIAVTLATVATAGTYRSVTINTKGLVTSGTNPTTIAGYGITDSIPFSALTASTPATLGWYRIATSAVNIGANSGTFKIDFSGTGVRGSALFRVSCHDGSTIGSNINQLGFTSSNLSLGLTQVRVVYNTTPTANYAYVEIYNPTALIISYAVDLINTTGWTLVTPSTVGSIPAGYSSESLTLDTGIVSGEDVTANRQLVSKVAQGTPPIVVASNTVVPNLNSEKVNGVKITDSDTAPVAPAIKDMWIDNVNNKIQRWNGSTWDNVSGGTAVSLRNTVTVSTNTSIVAINIPTFDNNADTLFVYKNSTYIERVVDYTVSGDSLVINKVSGTWDGTVNPIRFNFVIIKNLDKSGVLTVPTALTMNTYEKEWILVVPQSNVVIGIPEFSALTDKLIVHKNGTFLKQNVDYTLNVDGLSVDNISGTWEAGAVIDFLLFKNVISVVDHSDPSLIPDGGIVLTKLNPTIQARINTIDGLNEVALQWADMAYKLATGTATALLVTMPALVDGYTKTFIASATSTSTAKTINGKAFYKPGTVLSPSLTIGKAYTVWYNLASNCFFIKASAEGTSIASDVLAGKTFSNDEDTGLTGTMVDRGTVNITPSTSTQTILGGKHSGAGVVAAVVAPSDKIVLGTTIAGVAGTFDKKYGANDILQYNQIRVDAPYETTVKDIITFGSTIKCVRAPRDRNVGISEYSAGTNSKVIVGLSNGDIAYVDTSNGSIVWQFNFGTNLQDLDYYGGFIYALLANGLTLKRINVTTGVASHTVSVTNITSPIIVHAGPNGVTVWNKVVNTLSGLIAKYYGLSDLGYLNDCAGLASRTSGDYAKLLNWIGMPLNYTSCYAGGLYTGNSALIEGSSSTALNTYNSCGSGNGDTFYMFYNGFGTSMASPNTSWSSGALVSNISDIKAVLGLSPIVTSSSTIQFQFFNFSPTINPQFAISSGKVVGLPYNNPDLWDCIAFKTGGVTLVPTVVYARNNNILCCNDYAGYSILT